MKTILVSLLTVIGVTAWGFNNFMVATNDCFYPDDPTVQAPSWICNQNTNSKLITAVGKSAASAAGASFSKNMATADARIQLAQRVRDRTDGVSQTKQIVLKNSRPMNHQLSPKGMHYVQIGIKTADL